MPAQELMQLPARPRRRPRPSRPADPRHGAELWVQQWSRPRGSGKARAAVELPRMPQGKAYLPGLHTAAGQTEVQHTDMTIIRA